jgi:hypothetical protein
MKRILLLVTVAFMLAAAMALSGVAQAASPSARCQAEAETSLTGLDLTGYNFIAGKNNKRGDDFTGQGTTGEPDVFCGFGGNDGIDTLEAGDIFIGGDGIDGVTINEGTFYGGAGADSVYSNLGTYYGGADNDEVFNNTITGTFYGGEGPDHVEFNYGTFNGGDGNDTYYANYPGAILVDVP